MTYLLDVDTCIALITGRPDTVRRRFQRISAKGETIATSSIVLLELWSQLATSRRTRSIAARIAAFASGPLEVLDFTAEDAEHASRVRAVLDAGKPMGAYDALIAGQALRFRSTLVTVHPGRFSRVRDIRLQDWTAPPR